MIIKGRSQPTGSGDKSFQRLTVDCLYLNYTLSLNTRSTGIIVIHDEIYAPKYHASMYKLGRGLDPLGLINAQSLVKVSNAILFTGTPTLLREIPVSTVRTGDADIVPSDVVCSLCPDQGAGDQCNLQVLRAPHSQRWQNSPVSHTTCYRIVGACCYHVALRLIQLTPRSTVFRMIKSVACSWFRTLLPGWSPELANTNTLYQSSGVCICCLCVNGLTCLQISAWPGTWISGRVACAKPATEGPPFDIGKQTGGAQDFGDRAFCYAAPKLWNHLPVHLRLCDSLVTFKAGLKTCLFKRAFEQWYWLLCEALEQTFRTDNAL